MVYKRVRSPVDTAKVLIVMNVVGVNGILHTLRHGIIAVNDGADAQTLVIVSDGKDYTYYLLSDSPNKIENRIKRAEVIYL